MRQGLRRYEERGAVLDGVEAKRRREATVAVSGPASKHIPGVRSRGERYDGRGRRRQQASRAGAAAVDARSRDAPVKGTSNVS